MFIKIEIDSQDAVVYKLSRPDFVIGSSTACHIFLNDTTISKKHLRIVFDEGSWWAMDQGSTNGTFIDEDQLVPGKKVKLEPDHFLRLGSKVTLMVLERAEKAVDIPEPSNAPQSAPAESSAQASISSAQDRTRIISLDDLKQAKALADQKKEKELAAKRAAERKRKKKEQQRTARIIIICIACIAGGIWANKRWQKGLEEAKKEGIAKKLQTEAKERDEIITDVEGFRIARSALLSRNQIIEKFSSSKCFGENTSTFCTIEDLTRGENGLVIDEFNNYIFFLEQTEVMNNYKKLLPIDSVLDFDSLQKLTFLHFFKTHFVNLKLDPKAKFYFSFYRYDDQKAMQLSIVFAFNPASAEIIMNHLKKVELIDTDEKLKEVISLTNEYFTTY